MCYMEAGYNGRAFADKAGNRSKEIDVLKGIGILMMVAGHMTFSVAIFNKYVYAFHMPLFFLISGYLYHRPSSVKDAVLRKAKALLFPYFIFGIGYSVLWSCCVNKDIYSIGDCFAALLFSGTNGVHVEVSLWFLLSSFITYIVFLLIDLYGVSMKCKLIIVAVLTLIGCVLTPFFFDFAFGGGYSAALSALGFFYIGVELRNHWSVIKKHFYVVQNKLLFIGMIFVNTVLIFVNGRVNMRSGKWAILPLSYINAVIGTWIWACIAIYIVNKTDSLSKILQYIGKNAIVFVCTNHPMIRISTKIVSMILQKIGSDSYILAEILIFMIAIVLTFFLVELLNKTKLCILVGR